MQFFTRSGDRRKPLAARANTRAALAEHVPLIAKFALAAGDSQLNARIPDLVAQGWVGDALVKHVLEPSARVLKDAWLADDCSELELTFGLSMLQLAGHVVNSRPSVDGIRKSRFSILLVTAPGEPHMLGSSFLGDMFNNAGWDVDMAFPKSNKALATQLRAQRPDAVDIALSDALPRHHALAALRATIEQIRSASPDDIMVVSVGGRLFAETTSTALSVGADHARASAVGTSVRLAQLIEERRLRH